MTTSVEPPASPEGSHVVQVFSYAVVFRRLAVGVALNAPPGLLAGFGEVATAERICRPRTTAHGHRSRRRRNNPIRCTVSLLTWSAIGVGLTFQGVEPRHTNT